MIILGIETSCDETAAAVVENGTEVLSNIVASSAYMHAKTGGIIPEQAAREQIKSIIPVIDEAHQGAFKNLNSNTDKKSLLNKIDAIAVTYGPGLIGSLLVGVESAKTLSWLSNKPIIPVNHLVAHIYANFINENQETDSNTPVFPALALVVSGGHTDLVLMKDHGNIKWIGGTRDDAAGEAFDKTARLLGLPYPGGPAISETAGLYLVNNPSTMLDLFPRPLLDEKNFDWSFSGLKTAVARELEAKDNVNKKRFSAEVQEAIVDSLVVKSINAIKEFKPKSFLISGGVAANKRLTEKFKETIAEEKLSVNFFAPSPKLATDNAAVIASAAYFNFNPVPWQEIEANPQLSITDAHKK